MIAYKRILLKLSGEALSGEAGHGIDPDVISGICDKIKEIVEMGVQVSIVVGGGNFWRGLKNGKKMNDRSTADYMGMLATVMNGLALQDALEERGIYTRVQTSIEMREIAEPFIKRKATKHLEKGRVVIFSCGTGHPYFSTDTATVLRAVEIEAEGIYLAKAIDGVYDSDPKINPEAKKYDEVSIQEVIDKKLAVVDFTASIMCMENKMPMYVFGLNEENSILKSLNGDFKGTKVTV